MDIKKIIEQVVSKVSADKNFAEEFKKDPAKKIKSIITETLTDDQLKEIIAAVKAKVQLDDIAGVAGKLGDLFK